MWNLKYDTDEPIYETETGTQRIDWWFKWIVIWKRDGLPDANWYIQNGKQYGPT